MKIIHKVLNLINILLLLLHLKMIIKKFLIHYFLLITMVEHQVNYHLVYSYNILVKKYFWIFLLNINQFLKEFGKRLKVIILPVCTSPTAHLAVITPYVFPYMFPALIAGMNPQYPILIVIFFITYFFTWNMMIVFLFLWNFI